MYQAYKARKPLAKSHKIASFNACWFTWKFHYLFLLFYLRKILPALNWSNCYENKCRLIFKKRFGSSWDLVE